MSIYKRYCDEEFDERGKLTGFHIHHPDNFNFGYDVVDAIADEEPGKRAIMWCNTEGAERMFTFGELKTLSNKAANVLLDSGIKKGDKVMLMLKRHYEYWILAVALHKIGAIMIPVTNMLTVHDIVYRIKNAGIKAIVCTSQDDAPEKVLEAVNESKMVEHLWTVQKDCAGFRNMTTDIDNAGEELERIDTKALDPMMLYFTSGTTGYPKGVIHDYTYPLAHIITAKYWHQVQEDGLHFAVAETGWAKTSWGKIYGQWLAGCAVMVFDFDNFDPKQLVTIINKYKVTTFCAPPTVYRYLVKKGIDKMSSLVHATTAGEALNPEVFRKFRESTGIELMEGFGQTESTLILGNLAGTTPKPGAMGKETPLYHVEVMREDGSIADAGEVGELVIVPRDNEKQIGIFCKYLDNEALYKHAWRGGVYHTGDTVWKDEDGYFWFNGRIDDVIKTGGFRVGPFEIENVVMQHPAVLECSAIGVPDTLRGQAIKVFIHLASGYEASSDLQKEIKEFCNSQLAEYKWIRLIEFVEEMPKTISGKIKKTDLREQ
ncbi:MAG: acetyl-CoA synthetase [Lachnospiraceae bacterium]|nr:acetyl-CoA synthetase [Lachnospiraceae bacterium]